MVKGIKKTQGIITDLQGGQVLPVMPSMLRTPCTEPSVCDSAKETAVVTETCPAAGRDDCVVANMVFRHNVTG